MLRTAFVIGLDRRFPAGVKRLRRTNRTDGVADGLKVERRTGFVTTVVDGMVSVDADAVRRGFRVDIGAQKQEFPMVLFLLLRLPLVRRSITTV